MRAAKCQQNIEEFVIIYTVYLVEARQESSLLERWLLEAQKDRYDQIIEHLNFKELDKLAYHFVHDLADLLFGQCRLHLLFRCKVLILIKLKLDLHVPHDDLAKLLLQVLLSRATGRPAFVQEENEEA